MEKPAYRVVWTLRARRQMLAAYDYICEDSVREANKVLDAIEQIVDSLPDNPLKHAPDKYRRKNAEGTYRAFQKHHYRVAYRIFGRQIRIVQVRHTSRKPRYY